MAMYEFNKYSFNEEVSPERETQDIAQHRRSLEALWHSAPPVPPHMRHPAPPVPPHMRRQMLHIVFEDKDVAVFQEVFGDEDTAVAAMDILCGAPPEIQILALQILHMIERGQPECG